MFRSMLSLLLLSPLDLKERHSPVFLLMASVQFHGSVMPVVTKESGMELRAYSDLSWAFSLSDFLPGKKKNEQSLISYF